MVIIAGCGGDENDSSVANSDNDAVVNTPQNDGVNAIPANYTLSYSTYLGGSAFDRAQGVFVDDQGFIYLGGNTNSADFPTTSGALDETKNGPSGNVNDAGDGFVAKFSPSGVLLWSTLIGGTRRDQIYQVRVDDQGYVYAVGMTGSDDLLSDAASAPGFDQSFNGPKITNGYGDIFIVKLSPNGGSVVYWTYVGGSGRDGSRGNMFLNSDGSLYVSGSTRSTDFPIPGGMSPPPYQSQKAANEDTIVFKLSSDGQSIEKATYLGGSGFEAGFGGVEVSSDGGVIVAGGTTSPDFPGTAPGEYGGGSGGHFAGGDGYVSKLSADLSQLHYSLYVGGSKNDSVLHNQGLAVSSSDQPILLMSSNSTDLLTTNGSKFAGVEDVYLAVVVADGSRVEAATYIGGSDNDYPSGITVNDSNGLIYFSGQTFSTDYPTTANASGQNLQGSRDVILTIVGPDMSIVYSTYLEGAPSESNEDQRGRGVWLGPDESIYASGITTADFPVTATAHQTTPGGKGDAFLIRYAP